MRKVLEYAACVALVIIVLAAIAALVVGAHEIGFMLTKSGAGTCLFAVIGCLFAVFYVVGFIACMVALVKDLHYEIFERRRP